MKPQPNPRTNLFQILVIVIIALFVVTGCGSTSESEAASSADQETEAGAETAAQGATTQEEGDVAGQTAAERLAESGAASAEEQDAAVAEAEQEEAAAPATAQAEALVNLNLRQGPDTSYPIAGKLSKASEITLVGRNEDSSWLVGRTETGEEVWLSADPNLVAVETDLVAALPVADEPPLPYNLNNPQVNNILNMIPLVVHHEQKNTCASHGGLNHLLPEVANGNVLGPHAGDFVYKGDNVLFKYTNGTFQLIKENPVARFENGEEFLPFTKAIQLFESGEIVWNGSFGDLGRGVHGCDKSAP